MILLLNFKPLLHILLASIIVLAIILIVMLIWYIIWHMIFLPINKKDSLEEKLKTEELELQKIQAAKGVEWDRYKEITEEIDKLRKSYLDIKKRNEELQEKNVKLEIDKENLSSKNKELKKTKLATSDK